MTAARHDFAVDLDRHAAFAKAQMCQQPGNADLPVQGMEFTVQHDAHGSLLEACTRRLPPVRSLAMIGRHAGAVQCRSACGDSIDRVRYRKPPMLLQYLPRTHRCMRSP